jgi:hypothetical protein
MILGLDLDNTIICYDGLFHQRAVELDVIPPGLAHDKESVSDYLKSNGKNDVWTQMQAEIYGPELHRAHPFPGALDFINKAAAAGVDVHIISHKTQFAAADPDTDLRECAMTWLRAQNFIGQDSTVSEVYFAETRKEKVARIAATQCTHFVDDLAVVFQEPGFPADTSQILFDPNRTTHDWTGEFHVSSWAQLTETLFGK